MQDLNALAKQIHENAKAKGFWDNTRNVGEVFMLIVSELSEALEAHRKGKICKVVDFEKWMYRYGAESVFQNNFEVDIKDTFQDELADVVIRTLDFCYYNQTDIEKSSSIVEGVDIMKVVGDNVGQVLMNINSLIVSAYVATSKREVDAFLYSATKLCFSLAESQGFDLMQHIELKMQYNATREHLYGKKY